MVSRALLLGKFQRWSLQGVQIGWALGVGRRGYLSLREDGVAITWWEMLRKMGGGWGQIRSCFRQCQVEDAI